MQRPYLYQGFSLSFIWFLLSFLTLTACFYMQLVKKLSCVGTNTEHLLLSFVEQVAFVITLFSKD